ncbi:tripartite motif-containing protein 16 [Osmerus mordax]|uniref:tripartite motif-containing protein 16 n=1 Tax=Osmerus mordax TaxID=8014 RepID=UPI00350F920A
MVDQQKETGSQETAFGNGHRLAGPGDVSCDFCTEAKFKAVKSCLGCLASYCVSHVRSHYESPALRKHALVEATVDLKEKVCSHHDKLLEVYCRTDHRCVCLLCVMEEHRGHDTVPAVVERTERQRQLARTRRNFKLKIQAKEKELLELRRVLESLKFSAQAAVEESERIFSELLHSIERRHLEVRELIRVQEETAARQARDLLGRLDLEVAELRRRDAELDKLVHTEDHIYFLQNYQYNFTATELTKSPGVTVVPPLDFVELRSSMSALKRRLEDLVKGECCKISRAASAVKLLQCPEPKTREEFLYYSCKLPLDPKTAHRDLKICNERRAVTVRTRDHFCPDHPERFEYWCQVLSSEALSGRCYLEAEWSGSGAKIAVAYQSIARKGERNDSHFGHNDKSWSLFCSRKGYTFWHNNAAIRIVAPMSSRIGVYLDHRVGTLAFYSIADTTMTLLHRVQTVFSQPLFLGFEFVCFGVSLRVCQVE